MLVNNKINKDELIWLAISLSMAIIPHVNNIPAWFVLFFILLTITKLGIVFNVLPVSETPEFSIFRIIRLLLMISVAISVYAIFGTLIGRDAGISLLVMLTGFKILESENGRDFYIAIFLGYFLIVTNFLYTQSIFTAIYMLITLMVMTVSLIIFNDSKKCLSILEQSRYAGTLILQTVPLMVILFLFFPRIEGPLWGMPKDAHAGKIGLSDEMTPGAISQLVQSNEVAFRVNWNNPEKIPKLSDLYWRGPVFWQNDGQKWTAGRKIYADPVPVTNTGSKIIDYTITIEPNNKRWIFALELLQDNPANTWLTHDYLLLSRKPINNPSRYQLSSLIDYHLPAGNSRELYYGLQLPDGYHKKTIELARSWREEGLTPDQIINKTLRWFNEDQFFYTLSPPLLLGDNIDEFLFETKQGFCEHFASAFVTLMRAAGIPARVVTGYQGGTYNPLGDYLIVYQRNAHAWSEVWLKNKGWIRIDPTSAVSPARVNQGIESALPNEVIDVPQLISVNSQVRKLWDRMRYGWDVLNNQWNQWVISYGPQKQIEFFYQFGFKKIDWQALLIGLMSITFILFLIIAMIMFINTSPTDDPALKLYKIFCKKMAGKGIIKNACEGPLDFANRSIKKFTDLSDSIHKITGLYISVRYGDQDNKINLLRREVRAFNP